MNVKEAVTAVLTVRAPRVDGLVPHVNSIPPDPPVGMFAGVAVNGEQPERAGRDVVIAGAVSEKKTVVKA